jgi:hypothetical protein
MTRVEGEHSAEDEVGVDGIILLVVRPLDY